MLINTLMASLFIYKMAVLLLISMQQLNKIQDIISHFLWKGKRAKIPMEILQNDKSHGGLKLMNFRARQISVHMQWIKRLHQDPILDYAYHLLCPKLRENIWKCNISPKDVTRSTLFNHFGVISLLSGQRLTSMTLPVLMKFFHKVFGTTVISR